MASELRLTYYDYGTPQEGSHVKVRGDDLTAANFDAQIAMMNTLATAIDGITLGVRTKTEKMATVVNVSPTQPEDPFAQRETKWLVRYRDDTTGELLSV